MPGGSNFVALSSCLVLTLLAVGCGRPRVEQALKLDIALPEDARWLAVEVPNGPVTIEAVAGREITVDAFTRRIAKDEATLEALKAIDFEPKLTAGAEVGAYDFVAPGLPEGMDDRESALIFKGLIRLPGELGVSVRTGRGDLAAKGFAGPVRLETSAGSLRFADMRALSEASTLNGTCMATGHRGGLRLETGQGAIVAFIDDVGPEGIDLVTSGPSVTCRLPADVNVELDLRVDESDAGKIGVRNSFGVPVEASGRGHQARGKVGSGGPVVRIRVSRGWISVAKAPLGN